MTLRHRIGCALASLARWIDDTPHFELRPVTRRWYSDGRVETVNRDTDQPVKGVENIPHEHGHADTQGKNFASDRARKALESARTRSEGLGQGTRYQK